MRVSEIMSKCVTVCTEDTGLEEVYELIQKCAHKLVVVVDSNAPEELRAAYPDSALQFVKQGDQIGVFLDKG